ncbi:hypothetical protein Rs2_04620 [Raphanus sativus]|uniref:Uncharacterized protein LOC108837799 n=1 Tax=Raphanus sativus TaxID=3726 RepID=A0A9W3CAU5_RAPSA|nr:uncharacterized protein LOC108837799 [Raphanus sativus]KAJ4909999.1 hypothetical protein Rs2_04620 [Raphanus sativus]
MAQTDESSSTMSKARDLLATPSHEPLTIIVDQLFTTPQQSIEHQTARALYDFCVANFSNCLTLMLLKVYRFSSVNVTRLRSIFLLSETLTKQHGLQLSLSPVALNHIKPFLVSCLKMLNATNKRDNGIFRIIVSRVASSMMFDTGHRWDELGLCILSLLYTDPLKAFNVFVDLPPIHGDFINIVHLKLQEEVYKVLFHPDDDWSLGLETAIKLGLQVSDTEKRSEILETVVKSAEKLVSMGMEKSLKEALERLLKFLAKDATLCKWIGARETAEKISQLVNPNPCFKLSLDYGLLGQDHDVYVNLCTLSAVEILSSFAKTKHDDRFREIAMRRLHDLLCDHTSGKWGLDVSEFEKLQPMLISCLKEEVMPENTFEILGKVVYHVAMETFGFGEDPWFDLWDYIASESEFEKAVYIFQCLTMRFDDGKLGFVVPAVSRFLPEISSRLNPPRAVLVDDHDRWVLAFTGGFCVVIRLVNEASHAGFVEEIAVKMIESVKVLVERGMEVGLVRRAFRVLERIVEEQWDWYEACEYRLVKGLLRRLYEIKGMKMESKMVLWRISGTLERNVNEELRVRSGLNGSAEML